MKIERGDSGETRIHARDAPNRGIPCDDRGSSDLDHTTAFFPVSKFCLLLVFAATTMPVKESELAFDAYDLHPNAWLRFRHDLEEYCSGKVDESGSSLWDHLLDMDMGVGGRSS